MSMKGERTIGLPEGVEEYKPQREGDYFIHSETGEQWNKQRIDELKSDHLKRIALGQQQLAEAGNQIAQLQSELQLSKENAEANDTRADEAEARYKSIYSERYQLAQENKKLDSAVSELKSILFSKELTIAQNSGYIARVRECEKSEVRTVEVPATMLNIHDTSNQVMPSENYAGQNTWSMRWWNIGTDHVEQKKPWE